LNKLIFEKIRPAYNTPLYFIAVSVLTTKHLARNNGGAARQESNPQSATQT